MVTEFILQPEYQVFEKHLAPAYDWPETYHLYGLNTKGEIVYYGLVGPKAGLWYGYNAHGEKMMQQQNESDMVRCLWESQRDRLTGYKEVNP